VENCFPVLGCASAFIEAALVRRKPFAEIMPAVWGSLLGPDTNDCHSDELVIFIQIFARLPQMLVKRGEWIVREEPLRLVAFRKTFY
jgi:hypothetical protein